MFIKVAKAKYKKDFMIDIVFNDGKKGTVDLEDRLWGEVFSPLKDKKKFRSFHVDPVLETIVWKNGADLAPEFLYERAIKSKKH